MCMSSMAMLSLLSLLVFSVLLDVFLVELQLPVFCMVCSICLGAVKVDDHNIHAGVGLAKKQATAYSDWGLFGELLLHL